MDASRSMPERGRPAWGRPAAKEGRKMKRWQPTGPGGSSSGAHCRAVCYNRRCTQSWSFQCRTAGSRMRIWGMPRTRHRTCGKICLKKEREKRSGIVQSYTGSPGQGMCGSETVGETEPSLGANWGSTSTGEGRVKSPFNCQFCFVFINVCLFYVMSGLCHVSHPFTAHFLARKANICENQTKHDLIYPFFTNIQE